jgi:hypothetical protein
VTDWYVKDRLQGWPSMQCKTGGTARWLGYLLPYPELDPGSLCKFQFSDDDPWALCTRRCQFTIKNKNRGACRRITAVIS